jgi:magnesium transporter
MEEINVQHLPFELTKEFLEDIRQLISAQANEEIIAKIEDLFPADITHILYELTGEEAKYIVQLLDTKIAAEIISTLDSDDRKKFLKNLPPKKSRNTLTSSIPMMPWIF